MEMKGRTIRRTFLLFFIVIVCSTDGMLLREDLCPQKNEIYPCECKSRGMEALISCRGSTTKELQLLFSVIVRRLPLVSELLLENNYIPEIFDNFFGSLRMRKLMLWSNKVESVSDNALKGLQFDLEEIFIREDRLFYLSDNVFETSHKLKIISIENTPLETMPNLENLKDLKSFELKTSLISKVEGQIFETNSELVDVTIAYSDLKIVPPLSSSKLWKVKHVNLSYNEIEIITSRALEQLPNLEILDLSHNSIDDLQPFSVGMQEGNLLLQVIFDGNRLQEIESNTFQNYSKLTKVSLNKCDLSYIGQRAFNNLPVLTSVDFSENSLQMLTTQIFFDVPKLESVNLKSNLISDWREVLQFLNECSQLEELNLDENKLEEIDVTSPIPIRSQVRKLCLARNQLMAISGDAISFHFLEFIDLGENSLESSALQFPWPKSLKVLNLSKNKINTIRQFNLENLDNLKILNLSDSELFAIEEGTFLSTRKLTTLDISRNHLENLNPNQLEGLDSLLNLNISFNHLQTLHGETFRNLYSIENFDLSYNKLLLLDVSVFPQTTSLLHLNLAGNYIQELDYKMSHLFRNLEFFSLRGNNLTTLDERSLIGLERLKILDLSQNNLSILSRKIFQDLKNVIELDLSYNSLYKLDTDLFSSLYALMKLNISHNAIQYLEGRVFKSLLNLKVFDISGNVLTSFPSFKLENLRVLDASNNHIANLYSFKMPNFPSLSYLDLKNNSLEFIGPESFRNSESLLSVHLSFNKIKEIPPYSFSNLPSLRHLSLDHNEVAVIRQNAFTNVRDLDELNLSNNQIYRIDFEAFHDIVSISNLNLSNNQMNTISRSGIEKLSSLEKLDLSSNNLIEIDDVVFRKMERLAEIKVQNNVLCQIYPRAFSSQKALSYLDLRENKIQSLLSEVFGDGPSAFLDIKISGNPLSCTCRMEWLLKRITSNQIFYSEFHEHSNPKKKRRTELRWLVGEDGGRFYRAARGVEDVDEGKLICHTPAEFNGNDLRSVPLSRLPCNNESMDHCEIPLEKEFYQNSKQTKVFQPPTIDNATTETTFSTLAFLPFSKPESVYKTPNPFDKPKHTDKQYDISNKGSVKNSPEFIIDWKSLRNTLLPPLIAGTKMGLEVLKSKIDSVAREETGSSTEVPDYYYRPQLKEGITDIDCNESDYAPFQPVFIPLSFPKKNLNNISEEIQDEQQISTIKKEVPVDDNNEASNLHPGILINGDERMAISLTKTNREKFNNIIEHVKTSSETGQAMLVKDNGSDVQVIVKLNDSSLALSNTTYSKGQGNQEKLRNSEILDDSLNTTSGIVETITSEAEAQDRSNFESKSPTYSERSPKSLESYNNMNDTKTLNIIKNEHVKARPPNIPAGIPSNLLSEVQAILHNFKDSDESSLPNPPYPEDVKNAFKISKSKALTTDSALSSQDEKEDDKLDVKEAPIIKEKNNKSKKIATGTAMDVLTTESLLTTPSAQATPVSSHPGFWKALGVSTEKIIKNGSSKPDNVYIIYLVYIMYLFN